MSGNTNPYILFLILILLILGTDPDCDRKLGTFKTLIEKAATTLSNIKIGAHSLHSDIEEMHVMMLGLKNPSGVKGGQA